MTSWRHNNGWHEGGHQQITQLIKVICLQTKMRSILYKLQSQMKSPKLKAEIDPTRSHAWRKPWEPSITSTDLGLHLRL